MIDKYLDNDSKNYLILDLNNISISELKDNVFSGLQFKRIFLRNLKQLTRIHKNVFNGTEEYTEELTIEGDNRLFNDKRFKEVSSAISSLRNLESLYLDVNHMTSVPSNAFHNAKLSDIDFSFNRARNGSIKRVKDFAFYHQNDLVDLDLTHQEISFIEKNAFTFEKDSNQTLHIFLDHNHLKSHSFDNGLFNLTNRIIELSLRHNQIEYLDEKIFGPFLVSSSGNKIDLSDNPLVVDCRMAWILNYPQILLFSQILGGETKDGKKLIFLESYNFNNITKC